MTRYPRAFASRTISSLRAGRYVARPVRAFIDTTPALLLINQRPRCNACSGAEDDYARAQAFIDQIAESLDAPSPPLKDPSSSSEESPRGPDMP